MDREWLKAQFKLNPDKTKADLARYLELGPPAVSKILAGQRQIKATEYVSMRKFFGLPTDGQRAVKQRRARTGYKIESLSTHLQDKESSSDQDEWIMPAHLIKARTKAPPDKIKIFSVKGQAMAPDFMPGEQVLVDLSDTKSSPPGVFIISDGMSHSLRHCAYVPHSEPATVKISAKDPQIETYDAPLADIQITGRVIAKLEWL